MPTTHVDAPEAHGRIGFARRDVTPPVGMYHRMWGAATHDRSTGVHKPLSATAMVLAPLAGGPPRAFVALDHCLFWKPEIDALLAAASRGSGIPADRISVLFSHTHGAGLIGADRVPLPGGDLIPGYLRDLGERVGDAVREANESAVPATITFGTGRCNLAANRDFIQADGRAICGFNPSGPTDDTLLVGRVTADGGRTLGVLVNYACHPTTLAWENTLVSPDYMGSLREVVEGTEDGICFFTLGAAGDLGPVHGYVGDTAVVDRNGRQVGYAVLSTLEAIPPAGQRFHYTGPVVSGATLGRWDYAPASADRLRATEVWKERAVEVHLPYRADFRPADEVTKERDRWLAAEASAQAAGDDATARDARAMAERATRTLSRVGHLPPGPDYPFRTTLLRTGDAVWVPLDGEHYNVLQRRLRDRFPGRAVVVGTIANGSNAWYLPDADSYGKGLYQEEASVVDRGGLELLIAELERGIEELFS